MFGWLRKICGLIAEQETAFQVSFEEEAPGVIRRNNMYIIGAKEFPWQIMFLCPCGCKQTIQLNLLSGKRPRWKYKLSKSGISLSPSVWRTKGCRSHFIVRNSRVVWVSEFDE